MRVRKRMLAGLVCTWLAVGCGDDGESAGGEARDAASEAAAEDSGAQGGGTEPGVTDASTSDGSAAIPAPDAAQPDAAGELSSDAGGGDAGGDDAGAGGERDASGGGSDAGGDSDAGGACTELTYDNFGRDFLSTYCTGCHGGDSPTARLQFGSIAVVRANRELIVSMAVTSTEMPRGLPFPTSGQREQLGRWLTCGAP